MIDFWTMTVSRPLYSRGDIPDFLTKTALGCSLVVITVVIPFTINNLVNDRFVLALVTFSVTVACASNVWIGVQGRYSLPLNTYLVTPVAAIAIIYAMIELGGPASYWPILLTVSYYFVLPEKRAGFFNILTVLIMIPMALAVLDQPSAFRFSAVLLGISLFAYTSMREIHLLHTQLKEQAVKDKLTGLFNRSLLEDSLQQAIAQNRRYGAPKALIVFDIDHFKSVNDTFGHDIGDEVLKRLAELLNRRTRSSDIAFRAGGDEFVVLVHDTDELQGGEVAESFRREVEQAVLLPDRNVTISAGVSGLREGMQWGMWMKACDEKLYRAKEGGRNRVVA